MKEDEVAIRAILDKWIRREQELVILCIEVIELPFVSNIECAFDQVLELVHFDIEREIL